MRKALDVVSWLPATRRSTLSFATALGPMLAVSESKTLSTDACGNTAPGWGEPQLHGLYFEDQAKRPPVGEVLHPDDEPFLTGVASSIREVLRGEDASERLEHITLAPRGTSFQRQVWVQLRQIGHGQTLSYYGLACRLGRPQAVRAVAQALGRNPWIILNPCHRVLGSDGSLTGYAAGLERKRALLELELEAKLRPC